MYPAQVSQWQLKHKYAGQAEFCLLHFHVSIVHLTIYLVWIRQVHKRFWMQAHIIAFGMIAVGMSWAFRQTGPAARALAAATALILVCTQVGLLDAPYYELVDDCVFPLAAYTLRSSNWTWGSPQCGICTCRSVYITE